jgi:GDSL-like Lipase/Acylhydrolase family
MAKRLLLLFTSLAICLIASVVADRVAKAFLPKHGPGWVFPTNTTRHFQTPEFSFTVKTNSLGFRDREFSEQKAARIRVLAFGDSFTYGWGVEIDQSWPKVLEQRLRSAGLDVEVANLGKPAGSPRNYADIAERAVPALKPDLLIVAVLQGDDLAQMDLPPQPENNQNKSADASTKYPRARAIAKRLYPNFLALIDERENSEAVLANQWKHDAQIFMTVFTPEEKARLERIDDRARQAFLNGELNPALVYLSIHQPEYFLQTLDANSAKVRVWVSKMAEQFARIKNIAQRYNADVLIVSMPHGMYVSSAILTSRRRLGFKSAPEMLTTGAEDEAIRSACQMAGVRFYDYTREFRQASIQKDLFFELDGHLNVQGHNYFAELVAPITKEAITARSSK